MNLVGEGIRSHLWEEEEEEEEASHDDDEKEEEERSRVAMVILVDGRGMNHVLVMCCVGVGIHAYEEASPVDEEVMRPVFVIILDDEGVRHRVLVMGLYDEEGEGRSRVFEEAMYHGTYYLLEHDNHA